MGAENALVLTTPRLIGLALSRAGPISCAHANHRKHTAID